MVLKALGLNEKLIVKPILGFSDTETVMLDIDNTNFETVKYWAFRTMKWFKLGGFLLLRSSKDCYHVVFNRRVSWSENMRVVAWVSLESGNLKLQKYQLMQCIKQSSTLRVSSKRVKPSPRIVFRFGRQKQQIKSYIESRRFVKRIIKKMQGKPCS